MIKVIEISSDANLALFSQYLTAHGVYHRLTEERLNQVLWVDSESAATFVRLAFEKYQAGELEDNVNVNHTNSFFSGLTAAMRRVPLTLVLIALNILLFPVGMGSNELGNDSLFARLMLLEIEQVGGDYYFVPLGQTLAEGQWWRLLTPMLIHFSWLHIVFNLLWVWEIGRRIEVINGTLALFWLVAVASVMANVTQFMMSGRRSLRSIRIQFSSSSLMRRVTFLASVSTTHSSVPGSFWVQNSPMCMRTKRRPEGP